MNALTMHVAQAYGAQKIYLSPGVTRQLSADMPVGDAMGGPAFGKRAMPVIVIAMAASSFAAAATAFTAATTMIGMVTAGIAMVGSALSIVGTITGNQKLSMIGGIMTLGAGLAGGMANPFGGAEGAAGAAEGAMAAADTAGGMAAEFGSTAAYDAAISGSSQGFAAEMAAGLGSEAAGAADAASMVGDAGSIAGDAGATAAGGGVPVGQEAVQQAASTPYQTQAQSAFDAGQLQADSAFQTADPTKMMAGGGAPAESAGMIGGSGANGTSVGGYFDKFGKWVESNKGLVKIGTGVLEGAFPNNQTKASTDLHKAQAERIRNMTAEDKKRQLWRRGLITE